MDYEALFPGRFLRAVDFKGKDATLTIAGLRSEDLPQEKGGDKNRPILKFKETKKELVLNKTNAQPIAAMFGRETDGWMGHRVTFFPQKIDSGVAEIAIRVRGSPEIEKALKYQLKLPRRAPRELTLVPTGKKNGAAQAAPASGPEPVTESAETITETLDAAQEHDSAEVPGF